MIYQVAEYFTALVEAIMFYMLLDTFCGKRETIPKYVYYLSVGVLMGLIILVNQNLNYTAYNIVGVVFSTFVISFLFSGPVAIKAIVSILGFTLASVVELAVMFFIAWVYGLDSRVVVEAPHLRLLGIIFSKMLAFTLVNLICMIANRKILKIGKSYWIVFTVLFSNSSLAVFLLFKLAYEASISSLNYLLVICSVGLLLSTFFSFYMCERIAKHAEFEAKQEFFQQQIRAQSKHLNDILIAQKQVKKMRHDLANHNILLQTYFENHDWEAGLDYVKKMSPKAVFKEDIIETGNSAFDAIINTKRSIALSKNISFDAKLQIPENIFVDAVDICIIFGNALDNSIEACEKVKEGKRTIFISAVYEDNSLICKIVNSAVKSNGKFLHTTKSDKQNHGLGIENIRSALSKYKNVCRFKQIENEFILSFVIFEN